MENTQTNEINYLSEDSRNKAINKGIYYKLGSKGTLVITGALKYFQNHKNFVYLPQYRLAGDRDELQSYLMKNGLSLEQTKEVLSQSYNAQSIESTMKEYYDEELKQYKNSKSQQPEAHTTLKFDQVIKDINECASYARETLSNERKNATTQRKSGDKTSGGRTSGGKQKRSKSTKSKTNDTSKRNVQSLVDKYKSLPSGKYLDVSSLTSKGTGARIVEQPGEKSTKKVYPSLNIVSSSNEKMIDALSQLSSLIPNYDSNQCKATVNGLFGVIQKPLMNVSALAVKSSTLPSVNIPSIPVLSSFGSTTSKQTSTAPKATRGSPKNPVNIPFRIPTRN